jgi:uncharacterized protein YbaP (TraB family)
MLQQAHIYLKGGERTFAAADTEVSYAQFAVVQRAALVKLDSAEGQLSAMQVLQDAQIKHLVMSHKRAKMSV